MFNYQDALTSIIPIILIFLHRTSIFLFPYRQSLNE